MTASQFLEILASVSLQATIYIAACRWLAGRTSSDETRSRIWTNCQLGLLTLVILGSSLPHLRLVHGAELSDPRQILTTAITQSRIGTVLFWIWLTGAALSAFWVILTGIRMLQFLKCLDEVEQTQVAHLQHLLRAPRLNQIKVFISNTLTSPFCWQFQKPVVVLPRSFLSLESRELELILKHELAHLAANHPLHLFIQRMVQCLYWFHPVVYWAGRETDLAREMMCDTAAAGDRDEIAEYLQVLLKVIDQANQRQRGVLGLGLGLLFSRDLSFIARRARRLADRAKPQSGVTSVRSWLSACALLFVTMATAAWLPVNVLSSNRSNWSACPNWTAEILHDLGVPARDYEVYEARLQVFDREFERTGRRD